MGDRWSERDRLVRGKGREKGEKERVSLGEGENNKGLEMVEVEVVATSVRLRSIVCRCC